MKLVIKEKQITEQEEDDLKSHRFDQKYLESEAHRLDSKMHALAVPLQEKVPLQVAQKYFYIYGSLSEETNISNFVDEEGLVRLADIFIMAKLQDNINLGKHLDKYNKE